MNLLTHIMTFVNIAGTDLKGVKLGDFEGFFHDVSGSVYALNQSSLLVKDFTYDGTGPDAFFWAGTDSEYPRSGN